ncbi:MAG: universal stress protein [Thermoplasmata archaeon]
MFERALVAMDMSPATDKMTSCIAEFQEIGREEIILCHVIDIDPSGSYSGKLKKEHLIEKQKVASKMTDKQKELEGWSNSVIYEVPIGVPHREIAKLAKKKNVDLIVIGSRGKSKIKGIFLGSTVSELIRITEIPTLIEKIEIKDTMDRDSYMLICDRKFKSILLAIDFSENAKKAEEISMKLAEEAEKVTLVSVSEKDDPTESAKNKQMLESIKNKFLNVCDNVNVRVAEGTASQKINKIADEEDTTLIVLGKKGKGGIKKVLLGSTAENVARRSKKPILLVPP